MTLIFMSQSNFSNTVVPLLRDRPQIQQKMVSQKRWSPTRGGWGNGQGQMFYTAMHNNTIVAKSNQLFSLFGFFAKVTSTIFPY